MDSSPAEARARIEATFRKQKTDQQAAEAESEQEAKAQLEHRVLKRCSAPGTYADARGL